MDIHWELFEQEVSIFKVKLEFMLKNIHKYKKSNDTEEEMENLENELEPINSFIQTIVKTLKNNKNSDSNTPENEKINGEQKIQETSRSRSPKKTEPNNQEFETPKNSNKKINKETNVNNEGSDTINDYKEMLNKVFSELEYIPSYKFIEEFFERYINSLGVEEQETTITKKEETEIRKYIKQQKNILPRQKINEFCLDIEELEKTEINSLLKGEIPNTRRFKCENKLEISKIQDNSSCESDRNYEISEDENRNEIFDTSQFFNFSNQKQSQGQTENPVQQVQQTKENEPLIF